MPDSMTHQPDVTLGKEWRKNREEGVLIQFPSGKWARIRAIDPSAFLMRGQFPDTLNTVVEAVLIGKTEGGHIYNLESLKGFREYYDFLEFYARHCFISPRIVDNPQAEDEISMDDLETGDKEFLVQVVFIPASDLEIFSARQIERLGGVQPGKDDVQVAKRVNARKRVGHG